MKIIYSILFIIISYTAQAQNQSLQIAYFKHLVFRETPYAATKGRIPISEERSKKMNKWSYS